MHTDIFQNQPVGGLAPCSPKMHCIHLVINYVLYIDPTAQYMLVYDMCYIVHMKSVVLHAHIKRVGPCFSVLLQTVQDITTHMEIEWILCSLWEVEGGRIIVTVIV